MAGSPSIEQIVAQIRTALFGKDVRENIALGIEKCYEDSENNAKKTDVVNNVTTTDAGKILDARQGKVLNDKFGNYVETANIANDLTTTVGGKVLDARQGKILADKIEDVVSSNTNNFQYINPDLCTDNKYWRNPDSMGDATSYKALPPFHVNAGTYFRRGFISSFCWFKPDSGAEAYKIQDNVVILENGTVYISANYETYDINLWSFTNFNPHDYLIADNESIPYGLFIDKNVDEIAGIITENSPKQYISYKEAGHYWRSPVSKGTAGNWYAYDPFHVEVGYYNTNGVSSYSWFVPDDEASIINLRDRSSDSGIVFINKPGTIYISNTLSNCYFCKYLYRGYESGYGYPFGKVNRYEDISNIGINIDLLTNCEYSVSNPQKVTREGDIFTITGDDAGVNANVFESVSDRVKVDYEYIVSGADDNIHVRLYIAYNTSGGTRRYVKKVDTTTAETVSGSFIFDANSMHIYDDAVTFQIIIWGSAGDIIEMKHLYVYEESNGIETSPYYDMRLDRMLNNMSQAIESGGHHDADTTVLIDSNGNKHGLIIGTNGALTSYPFIPSKYLVFGNSISCSYNDPNYGLFGMASTGWDKDWVYRVDQGIKELNPSATYTRIYSSPFEHSETIADARSWMSSISSNLTSDIDLVLIEMGDNVNTDDKRTVFRTSFPEFISLIRTNCPHARIVVIGVWFNGSGIKGFMWETVEKYGIESVDITSIRNSSTESSEGTIIHYSDGTTGTVSAAAATHPGDAGHLAIGEAVLAKLDM